MERYATMKTKTLIYNYLWEKDRVNKRDMAETQKLIKRELRKRYNCMIRSLDSDTTADDTDAIFKRLIDG